MKFMVDDNEAEKVRRLLEAAEVNCVTIEDRCEDAFLDDLDRENCRKAADYLFEAFNWELSKEGCSYWEEVWNKLNEYGETGGF